MSVDYAAKLEKVRQQQERARNKQLAKMNDPEYKESMKAKARKRTELAVEKRKAKLSDPAYKESLIAKKKAADARKLEEAKNRPPTTKRPGLKKSVSKVAYRERAKTADEKRLWDELGQLPCVACQVHGKERHPVSIHHMRGRTSEMCHSYIIPLCDWHHDTPAPKEVVELHEWMIPRHAKGSLGGKPAFEAANAKETDLMLTAYTMIGRREEALKLLAL
ncbi:Ref family recombination enhancement nuclease [Rosenbergiella collisarenosi]|uniref:Ref family recombination enhancement nuclease n=1 Tax=Rosenbergiella collisarenosi TaxID=1544695 RepID=UPI001F4E09EB|nr:Ref family recombination enhancement nuclease [Rosenbergiella collisarenosi]